MEVVNSATGWIIRVTLREAVGGGKGANITNPGHPGTPHGPARGVGCRGSLVIAFKVACNAAEIGSSSESGRRLVVPRSHV